MRQILAVTALALALAAPAMAQTAQPYMPDRLSSDAEIRDGQEWQRTVAKANAERLGITQQEQAEQHAAIRSGASGTDATYGAPDSQPDASPATTSLLQASCPGTNEAGNPWHPGGYCLPGGR